jgi:hypothetical protein
MAGLPPSPAVIRPAATTGRRKPDGRRVLHERVSKATGMVKGKLGRHHAGKI